LLLSHNRHERIISNLGSSIPRSIRILQRHKTLRPSILLELLMFRALDQGIDAALSEEVCLCFFSGAGLAIVGALVHPFHAIDALSAACGFELALDFFLGALFAEFVDALLGLFALGEGFLFFFPDCALVALQ